MQRLRILEFTIDHEAPYFSKMRRRTSRKDSDLNGIVDVRYTGGARMLLLIEVGQGRWRFKVRLLSQSQSPPGTFLAIARLPPGAMGALLPRLHHYNLQKGHRNREHTLNIIASKECSRK